MNKEFEDYIQKDGKRINKVDPKQLSDGENFQDYVQLCLKRNGINISFYKTEILQRQFGEGPSGYEIKLDRRCTGYKENDPTNQLSIEYQKYIKNSANEFFWNKSGIFNHAKLPYYVQGNPDNFWIFKITVLEELLKIKKNSSETLLNRKEYWPPSQWRNNKPIVPIDKITLSPLRSFLLPLNYCDKFANIKFTNINDKMVMVENLDVVYNLETLKEEIKNSIKKDTQSIKELFS